MSPQATDPRTLVQEKVKEIPPLPRVVQQLFEVMRNPECSADEITKVLSTDQALTSKILRLVNSSFYGMSGSVTTISHAVVVLGQASLRSIATALTVADALGRLLPRQTRLEFWQHALVSAAGAEIIARRSGHRDPEEAFVGGLLHDIGHIVLMMALPGEYAEAAAAGTLGSVDAERQVIGLDHCRAGRMLLQRWKLPACHLEAARLHHAADACVTGKASALSAVALGDRLARTWGASPERLAACDDLLVIADALALSPEALIDARMEIQARARDAESFLGDSERDPEAAENPDVSYSTVVISGSNTRADWLNRLVVAHGHRSVPLRDHLLNPRTSPAELLIVDAGTINPDQYSRLAPMLQSTPARILTIAQPDGAVAPGLRPADRSIPLAFSAADLRLE